jgi:hypothetical protein
VSRFICVYVFSVSNNLFGIYISASISIIGSVTMMMMMMMMIIIIIIIIIIIMWHVRLRRDVTW